ncbi:MAG: hypothetical protein MUC56_08600 [Thermoanaerobaculales bacterium]|jgi:tetratricopeptide (TPR) repeat protein|nr:hypothetical protein [Thermoanaerobaculales bacterium]
MRSGVFIVLFSVLLQPAAAEDSGSGAPTAEEMIEQCSTAVSVEDCISAFVSQAGNPEAYSARALVRFGAGNLEGAEEDMTSAISLNPKNVSYFNFRAQIRTRMGLLDGAESDREIARQLVREGPPELEKLNQVLVNDPDNPEALLERSRIRRKLGDINGALADAEEYFAVMGVKSSRGVLVTLASLRKSAGDYEGSIEALSLAIDLYGGDVNSRAVLLKRRAIVRRLALDDEGAVKDEQEVIELTKTIKAEAD